MRTIVLAGVAVGCATMLILLLCGIPHPRKSKPRAADPLNVTGIHLGLAGDACEAYRRLIGTWPSNVAALTGVIFVKDTNVFTDGWGHALVLRAWPSVTNQMWLLSYGADGVPGGEGSNADIVYTLTAGP
ncbi:MAG: hypothetical protein C5B50_13595 [Verrucomicrobia bacterium]|nr:MAG: hypothetical protein C5B50_13595 [Verrucomicrobiota bacterium]